ncbi:LCP family protein [Enterococcus hulanensis]|uniref:LCP family glycopolymer transferase n=1 Tax=Enterococcus hulanensis TaxID=2559929 RepID=UPI00288D5CB1|nr:LCP family protein [Enterococcus hulanensis]MDT2660053.1 LCP family protein [Enterococcus hulanensis]
MVSFPRDTHAEIETLVNAFGGIEVDNPFEFTYDGENFPKGQQELNGEDALM